MAIDDIEIGETVLIRPGERVPTDARLVDGAAEIDESMLTGESMPTLKKRGDTVFAGHAEYRVRFQSPRDDHW